MIVRILEDGQYELKEADADALGPLDTALETAIAKGDETAFKKALAELITEVHAKGERLDAATITPSDLAVPAPGSTLAEVRDLLKTEDSAGV